MKFDEFRCTMFKVLFNFLSATEDHSDADYNLSRVDVIIVVVVVYHKLTALTDLLHIWKLY